MSLNSRRLQCLTHDCLTTQTAAPPSTLSRASHCKATQPSKCAITSNTCTIRLCNVQYTHVESIGQWIYLALVSMNVHFWCSSIQPFCAELSQHPTCYRCNELRRRMRVREVEQGTFSPLVFSTTGGMGNTATVVYKRIASLRQTEQAIQQDTALAQMQMQTSPLTLCHHGGGLCWGQGTILYVSKDAACKATLIWHGPYIFCFTTVFMIYW